jgi:hypothetical protein
MCRSRARGYVTAGVIGVHRRSGRVVGHNEVGKSRKRLDGPYDDLVQAESRAKVLATEFGSDAWFEDESKIVMAI